MPGPGQTLGWLLLLLALAGCAAPLVAPPATTAPAPPAPTPPASVAHRETGKASWYGPPHHGRRTASGEVYDMHDLTAAHRTLPFGTRLLVTNLDTGEAVEVRVNDRGPVARDRVLDLSYSAARVLGAVGPGIIRVKLSVVASPATASPDGTARFVIQLGAFTSRERADALVRALARDAAEAAVMPTSVGGDTYYRVRIGDYADRQSAEETARRLAGRGYRPVIVER